MQAKRELRDAQEYSTAHKRNRASFATTGSHLLQLRSSSHSRCSNSETCEPINADEEITKLLSFMIQGTQKTARNKMNRNFWQTFFSRCFAASSQIHQSQAQFGRKSLGTTRTYQKQFRHSLRLLLYTKFVALPS